MNKIIPLCIRTPIYKLLNPYKPEVYWEKRHKKINDIRSVGNVSLSVENNKILYKRQQAQLKKILTGKGSLLDAGCGIGIHSKFFTKLGYDVSGIDISKTAIQNARKELNGDFRVGSLSELPYDNNYFDVTVVIEVLLHIVKDSELIQSVKELSRVTKNGGLLVFEGVFSNKDEPVNGHNVIRSTETYKKIIEESGLVFKEMIKYKALNCDGVFMIFKKEVNK